ncbi:MAG: hypothetical protein IPN59_09225 [Holophaga sp.]|nr:hypothetical protein [Holophaga sp.]
MSINGVMTLPALTEGISIPSAMPPFSVSDIRKRTHAIQEIMRGVMKEGTHYGTIPGTPKPSLWKAGAEVIAMTFRLAPMLECHVVADDMESEWNYTAPKRDGSIISGTCIGFFEVEATCTIIGPTGESHSRCSARCNNREAKYRSLQAFEIRNTILKMAEKRAFVSAVLMATGASDIFTQDLEDFPELIVGNTAKVASIPKIVEACSEKELPAEPTKQVAGQGLSPKRQAWLLRVGQEAKVSQDAMDRCVSFLQSAEGAEVKVFFDEMARTKGEVFRAFMPA